MANFMGGRPRGVVSNPPIQASESPEDWEHTRAQTQFATQFLADDDDDLASAQYDIGVAVGDGVHELFVSCDPAPAMLQQFIHLRPEFIAVHDIGTQLSHKLLTGLANACGRTMQKLVIRRQNFGTPLATLEFIEWPSAEGRVVRLYTTETQADTASRAALARVLMSHSRLAVLLVGELPGHALAADMKSLRDGIITGPWPNHDILLLPLRSAAIVAAQGAELARSTSVTVHTTPQVTSAAEVWNFLSGSWHRLRERLSKEGKVIPELTTTQPPPSVESVHAQGLAAAQDVVPAPSLPAVQAVPAAPMIPMPEVPRAPAAVAQVQGVAPDSALGRYVQQISELKGVMSCCVFELAKVRSVAAMGAHPNAESLARSGAALMSSISSVSRSLGLGHAPPDVAITLGAHFLVLRPLPKRPGLVLHVVLDKNHANLTLARLQIERVEAVLDEDSQ